MLSSAKIEETSLNRRFFWTVRTTDLSQTGMVPKEKEMIHLDQDKVRSTRLWQAPSLTSSNLSKGRRFGLWRKVLHQSLRSHKPCEKIAPQASPWTTGCTSAGAWLGDRNPPALPLAFKKPPPPAATDSRSTHKRCAAERKASASPFATSQRRSAWRSRKQDWKTFRRRKGFTAKATTKAWEKWLSFKGTIIQSHWRSFNWGGIHALFPGNWDRLGKWWWPDRGWKERRRRTVEENVGKCPCFFESASWSLTCAPHASMEELL